MENCSFCFAQTGKVPRLNRRGREGKGGSSLLEGYGSDSPADAKRRKKDSVGGGTGVWKKVVGPLTLKFAAHGR